MKTLEQTIAAMLTENTGTHFLDSGGANGRAWQQNAGKTVEDFRAKPSATAEIYIREWKGQPSVEILPCVDVFHLLTGGALELCAYCDTFNALPVEDWDGEYSGVSAEGQRWLDDYGFEAQGQAFNTYNWAANHSQVMQGQELTCGEESFILLQIHGGADVRGGYTDAKLFKLSDFAEFYNVVTEDCSFSDESGEVPLSWYGEWVNSDGGSADDADLLAFATACGASLDNPSVTIAGDAHLDI